MQIISTYPVWIVYLAFFASALLFSLLINGLFLKFVHTLGIRSNDKETIIRWGPRSKPSLGGLTFYIIFLLSIASYSLFIESKSTPVYQDKEFLGLLLASNLGFLIGLADDSYDTKPLLKFAGQLGCGIILIVSGTYINISSSLTFNYLLTVFWVVGIMNAINMLDNMDAVVAMVGINIICSILILMYLQFDYFHNIHFIVLIGVLAALCGFLFFNWHPSKMYMGDTGSQFLGAFLATIGIIYLWNSDRNNFQITTNYQSVELVSQQQTPLRNLFLAVLIFILPIIDTTVVVFNRISRGHSPFVGGKDHTTHCLAHYGLSDRQVAVAYALLSLFSLLLLIIIIKYIDTWKILHTCFIATYIILLLAFFLFLSNKKNKKTSSFSVYIKGEKKNDTCISSGNT